MNDRSPSAGGEGPQSVSKHPIPVVGIGTSAGGLAALREFLNNMPDEPALAFVVVLHLDPHHVSHMSDLLGKYTRMQVVQAEHRMPVEANRVYIIPPNSSLSIHKGVLELGEPSQARTMCFRIDDFFRSLAKDSQERAIAVILTGTGSDGTRGLREVKAESGLVMVQDPDTAEHDGMPRSALATGMVDCVARVEKLPQLLVDYVKHARPGGYLYRRGPGSQRHHRQSRRDGTAGRG